MAPLHTASALVGATVLIWTLFVALKMPRPHWPRSMKALGTGLAAILVWVPALLATSVLVPMAAYLLVLGFIPLAILPLAYWGSFCAAVVLCRSAVEVLRGDRSEG